MTERKKGRNVLKFCRSEHTHNHIMNERKKKDKKEYLFFDGANGRDSQTFVSYMMNTLPLKHFTLRNS